MMILLGLFGHNVRPKVILMKANPSVRVRNRNFQKVASIYTLNKGLDICTALNSAVSNLREFSEILFILFLVDFLK